MLVLPFGQGWNALQSRPDRLRDQTGGQPLRLAVHDLDRGALGFPLRIEHARRVDHLPMAVEQLDRARHETLGSDRQHRFHAGLGGVEEDERHVPGRVLDQHAIGRAPASERRRAVLGHLRRERDRLADRRLGDRPFELARDGAVREVEKQVDHPRRLSVLADQPVERARHLRADAGQGAGRGEQPIENAGPERHRAAGARLASQGGGAI
jgi:hypothetical protein